MATVGIVDIRATLEAHTVVAGAVQVGGGIEVVDLLLLDACDGVFVLLRVHVVILLTASVSCGGYDVGMDGQTLGEEELVAGAYHTAVVQIDIVDEEPRADAVGLERAALFEQLHVEIGRAHV